jgi:hypothetical protein
VTGEVWLSWAGEIGQSRTSSVGLDVKRHDGAALGSDQSQNDLIASSRVVSSISLPFVSSTQAL